MEKGSQSPARTLNPDNGEPSEEEKKPKVVVIMGPNEGRSQNLTQGDLMFYLYIFYFQKSKNLKIILNIFLKKIQRVKPLF